MRLLCVGYISPSRPQVATWLDGKTCLWGTQDAADGAFFRAGGWRLAIPALDLHAGIHVKMERRALSYRAVVSAGPGAPA